MKSRNAALILFHRDLKRAGGSSDALPQQRCLRTGLEELREPVFDLLLRLEHGTGVLRKQRLKTSILSAHIIDDAAIVQDVPLNGRTGAVGEAFAGEEITKTAAAGALSPSLPTCRSN